MQVIVYFPDTVEALNEFEDRIAFLHATLILEKIKQVNNNDETKKQILDSITDI